MKIISWNCNMAFRKKAAAILAYKPDLLIIPECEHPDKLLFENELATPNDVLWFGQNRNKGLGIFSYCHLKLKVSDIYNDSYKMIVPITVSGGKFKFTLFAIWANNPQDPEGHYVTQIWKAVHHYEALITGSKSILIGDFNSNTIWDKPRREGNHSALVKKLETKKIHSVYHKYFNQLQGSEAHPTLYMYRHKDKPYHLDYCFASGSILKYLHCVEVGDYNFWMQYSDHVPIIITFDNALLQARNTKKDADNT